MLSLPYPLHAIERGGGGVWIVLFSDVTPFEDNISTTLSRIVG